MRSSSVASSVLVVGLVAGVAGLSLTGCAGGTSGNTFGNGAGSTGSAGNSSAAGATGAAGTTSGPAGTTGEAGSGAAGSTSGPAGTSGDAGSGAAGTTATAGTSGAAGAAAGTSGAAGTPAAGGDITKVSPTPGCNMDPGQAVGSLVMHTIQTMGTKDANCADSKCGAWSYARDYWVRLPTNYDKTKAYPLVFEGPGCGGHGNNLYNIPVFDATVIRVGLSPSKDAQAFHSTNPGQGCFDDKEGDDSVDWVFYEVLRDSLASTLCFDNNRVFAGGNSSGAWFSNEVGCKYAGDAKRPIRGIMPNTGGLPTDAKYLPTCTNKGMAGFWSHEINDGTNPFTGNIIAMNRALVVNGCAPAGVTYQTATFDPFPVGGDTTSCKRYKGCPELYPLVVCPLPGNSHASHDQVVDPGWPAFLKLFSTGTLITQ